MSSTSFNDRVSFSEKEHLVPDAERRRALFGSAVGSTIEWYDYFLYGTMSWLATAAASRSMTDALI